jgi:hypothetical protein
MSETQQRQKHPRLLLNIVLIILETFFSFILIHDGALRLQAKKFISNKTTIRINSYLPFFDFYVQFTEKGLLFDIHSFDRRIDLEINSTLIDLIKIFAFSNQRSLKNMRIDGDEETKKEISNLTSDFIDKHDITLDYLSEVFESKTPSEESRKISYCNCLSRCMFKYFLLNFSI